MPESMYQPTTPEVSARRKELAPEIHDAFEASAAPSSPTARCRRRRNS